LVSPGRVGPVQRVLAGHIPIPPFSGINSGSPNDPIRTSIARWTAVIGLLDPNGPFLRIIVCEGRGQLAVGIGLPLKR
jgi:hypothetical protein